MSAGRHRDHIETMDPRVQAGKVAKAIPKPRLNDERIIWVYRAANPEVKHTSLSGIARFAGCSKATLSKWLSGSQYMSNYRVADFADRFQVSPFWLLGWTNNPAQMNLADRKTLAMLEDAARTREYLKNTISEGRYTGDMIPRISSEADYRDPKRFVVDLADYYTRGTPIGTFVTIAGAIKSL